MSKLDELQKIISEQFANATDADLVRNLGSIKSLIDEAKADEKTLLDEHSKLKDEYIKEVKKNVVADKPQKENKATKKSAMDIAIEKGFIK